MTLSFRFQTTYEELKRLLDTAAAKTYNGFQTTYEELKQVVLRIFQDLSFLLSDYLWGIETP